MSGWPEAAGELARSAREAISKDLFAPPRPIRSNRVRLRDLLFWAGDDGAGRRFRRWGEIPGPITTPLPSSARRDVVLGLLGSPFLLHERSIDAPGRVRAGDRVHVYLDVSGSVHGILPALSGAVTDCARFVHPVVHAFSTEVAETTLPDLRKGRIRTTNGTDIRCVADHARRNRVTRAVIITDGYVGRPQAADLSTFEGIRLAAAWTPEHMTHDLAGLYGRSDILEVQA